MADEEEVSTSERLLFAMLVGAVVGAGFGTALLGDSTQGITTGIVVGTLAAIVFPTVTTQGFERVQELLDETEE